MKRSPADEETKVSITPLIDVTFLLLIFFMVTLKFNRLEQKVSAFLPKDRGGTPNLVRPPDELRLTVVLKRQPGEKMTRVKLVDTELGTGDAAFARLDERIREILTRGADPKGEINAAGDVPHGHVVRTIDSFMRAGIHNITFVGTKKP